MPTEHERLNTNHRAWRRWGPFLAERAWGTVREDYSADGGAWDYFPHDHARSRAYRWNEDGLLGWCDDRQHLCLAPGLWNGKDPILKERLFGLTGPQGNHGEDVKEHYFYIDALPSSAYVKMLYKYPQAEFPYQRLVEENARRNRAENEYEIDDTGIFDGNRYFDVFVEYAKAGPDDTLARYTIANRGPYAAPIWLLPMIWFRNTWAWGRDSSNPMLEEVRPADGAGKPARALTVTHPVLGRLEFLCDDADEMIFTGNDTNVERLYGSPNPSPFVKDAFHDFVIKGDRSAVNPAGAGTKAAAVYARTIEAGAQISIRVRLRKTDDPHDPAVDRPTFADFDRVFEDRIREADAYYASLNRGALAESLAARPELLSIQRQALAGLICSKQFYNYDVRQWLSGDPAQPAPPEARRRGRNRDWGHLSNAHVISMPDKWEYPWYATWDLAFHCIPIALADPKFAKHQLELLTREWFMHPNGQIPAYEWAFGDVNPPVLGWAAWRVFQMDRRQSRAAHPNATGDLDFLERVFHKLLLNFTWWVNRKDSEGKNVFQGGFLGLDNIGVFDRSAPLPTGGHIEQSDGTSWMGMFSLNMMKIALELAQHRPAYEDIASKFFEHFLYIAAAMNNMGGDGTPLWNEEDEFFYDVLHLPDGSNVPLKIRSMVGLIPLFAVETIEPDILLKLPAFARRMAWFLENRPDLAGLISRWSAPGMEDRRLVALTRGHRLKRLLSRMLDPDEFLGDYGVRALSKTHEAHPFVLGLDGLRHEVRYEPSESRSGVFGGNSNWRGPIWMPVNYLLIESLQKFHHYFGDDFKVECPTGSGVYLTLAEVADVLSQRLIRLFVPGADGGRPSMRHLARANDPHWKDLVLFFEYFDGDTGRGVGASHQTGWTALVAKLIQHQLERPRS